MYVQGSVTITKGFQVWKDMVDGMSEEMAQAGVKFIFAAVEANDDTKLHVILDFKSMDVAKEFMARPEIEERRRNAGVLIETTVLIPLGEARTAE